MSQWQSSEILQSLIKKSRLGLISDMDGTLSPIVPNPGEAQITPRNRELLQALQAHLTLVAIVSGRAVTDVRERVGLPGVVYVGNHGLERWVEDHVEPVPEASAYRPAIEAALDTLREQKLVGMLVEDKTVTISVHYRQTQNPEAVAQSFRPIAQQVAAENGLDLFQGRMIFELRPPIHINKGSAFRRLVQDYALEGAVYLGDDTTDIDALLMARQMRRESTCYGLALGVESEGTPDAVGKSADLSVSGVEGVESFLAWLLKACKASSTCE